MRIMEVNSIWMTIVISLCARRGVTTQRLEQTIKRIINGFYFFIKQKDSSLKRSVNKESFLETAALKQSCVPRQHRSQIPGRPTPDSEQSSTGGSKWNCMAANWALSSDICSVPSGSYRIRFSRIKYKLKCYHGWFRGNAKHWISA